MTDKTLETLAEKLDRLIEVVGRLAPAKAEPTDLAVADCFVWSAEQGILEPVNRVNRVDIGLIRGVDRVRDILIDNTERSEEPRLNSSHMSISYAVFCLKKKNK